MRAARQRQVDTKGTLARVEKNVRIARHCGARIRTLRDCVADYYDPRCPGLLDLLSPDERQARGELSPGLWINSFRIGWKGMTDV
jgi:hypothetical protein